MLRIRLIFFLLCANLICRNAHACSVLYYIDPHNGKIYVANNEDCWYKAIEDRLDLKEVFKEGRKKLIKLI
jgi:hypothetical protein